ncbi:MAG: acyltransferase [Bacteroidales bacterium]|nr:acyltransferase [Candidatus Cryptobacteroides caccocaballi]
MQRTLVVLFRFMPVEVLYAFMGMVIPFYMIFNRQGYLSSYHWFRRRFGFGPIKSFFGVYRNHFVFGQVILDRFATYAGKKFRFEFDGKEKFDALAAGGPGFMMVSSHVGNYELAGYSLSTEGRKFNALVFAGETETVMKNRNIMFGSNCISMIPMSEDMSHIFALSCALSNGEIVSMPGDRIFGSQKSVRCSFMGKDADFPMGPFALAVQKNVSALAAFVMKTGSRSYRVVLREIGWGDAAGKAEKIQRMAEAYAAEMGTVMGAFPYQWFNYYDFWKEDEN